MRVAPPLATVGRRRRKVPQGHLSVCGDVIEIRVLEGVGVGIGVVEHPVVVRARHIRVVAVHGHHVRTDDFHVVRPVFVEVEPALVRGMPGPGEDVRRIPPDKMRRVAPGIEHVDPGAVEVHRERPGAEAFLVARPPAVQEEEPGAVGIAEKVVEPVLRCSAEGRLRAAGERDRGSIGE